MARVGSEMIRLLVLGCRMKFQDQAGNYQNDDGAQISKSQIPIVFACFVFERS